MSDPAARQTADATPEPGGPRATAGGAYVCDFCGREAPRVRRIALDQGYDRLGTRHAVRYACDECSRRKEAERHSGSAG